jgi:hypothetical protein
VGILFPTASKNVEWHGAWSEGADPAYSPDDSYWGGVSSSFDAPVSDYSGVAPLAVHFFSDFVEDTNTDWRYRNLDFTWDFDDTSAGTWRDGLPKNEAKGANACHVFEEAGTYNVSLTVRNPLGVYHTEEYTITVSDPDIYFSGTNTICVSDTTQADFTGAPTGALEIITDDLSTVVDYAESGKRILFNRGSSWSVGDLDWPSSNGVVVIGAYGEGTNPDELGIYDNAPQITVTDGSFMSLSYKQNWRLSDLHLIDPTQNSSALGGASSIQNILVQRMKIEGFSASISFSAWYSGEIIIKNNIVFDSCDVSESAGACIYGGSERLAILGCKLYDTNYHCIRIWQAWRSVISHNLVYGSSLENSLGKHALKLHGPGIYHGGEGTDTLGEPAIGTGLVNFRTNYVMITHNSFGGSGSWPIRVGPQNGVADERITNVVIAFNDVHSDYGTQNLLEPLLGLRVTGQKMLIKNNIFDGTGASEEYAGMAVADDYSLLDPTGFEIYNNTVYRGDDGTSFQHGFEICSTATGTILKNNLVSFPNSTGAQLLVDDDSGDIIVDSNFLTDSAEFIDPDNVEALERDFAIEESSPAKGNGVEVDAVYEDFDGNTRTINSIGAYE